MSEEILRGTWARLPSELELAVLSRLPLQARARLRRVCRRWKALLDRTPRLWTTARPLATRLTLNGYWLWDEERPMGGRRPIGGFDSKATAFRFCSALACLAPSGRLVSLELFSPDNETLSMMLDAVAASQLQLRVLALNHLFICEKELPGLQPKLSQVLRGQPLLETLILGYLWYVGSWHTLLGGLEELASLRQLRVLFLGDKTPPKVQDIPASVLGRLDCLTHCYESSNGSRPEREEQAACEYVAKWAPRLRFRPQKTDGLSPCFLWAKEGFDVKAAMSDKALYSYNFLADYDNI